MELESEASMPRWVRFAAVVFAVLFGLLAFWMVGLIEQGGTEAGIGAVVAAAVAVRLLVGAARGSWKWVWSPWRMWR